MKKGLKSIKEWALRVFALIIKTVAPVWTVKYLTVWFPEGQSWYRADSKEKVRLFLPGAAKEAAAVQKLNLSEAQLRRHVWSEGTCEALLKQGNTALWFLARTKEAYDLVVATENADLIGKVFKTNTPSVEYLKGWLNKADANVVKAVIGAKPSVFNDLKMSDMRREYQHALLALYNADDKEGYNSKLAVRRAEEVIQRDELMRSYLTGAGWKEEKDLFDHAMQVAVDVDYDFTKSLDSLERYHENWYQAVRNRAGESKHLVAYIVERLPRVWFSARFRDLDSNKELESFDESFRGENWPRVMDARQWLQLAYEHCYEPLVARKALEVITDLSYTYPCGAIRNMQQRLLDGVEIKGKVRCGLKEFALIKFALKKMPERFHWQLKSKLYGAISSYAEAREAATILPKSYRKGLRAKIIKCTCTSDAEAFIRTYWPFGQWEQENAEAAVRKLAQLKKLPLEKLGELSKELQEAALEEVDVVSETAVLLADRSETSTPGQTEQKLLSRRLHPRSEAILFTRGCHWQEAKLQYISKFKMSEAGFKAMVNHCGNHGEDEERGYALVRAHAERWGLNEREYLLLYNSPYYSDLAAPLKGCQNETRQPSFEDGV